MGLLDGILGNVLGGMMGGGQNTGGMRRDDNPLGNVLGGLAGSGIAKTALMALAFHMLQRNGGITGLIEKFRGSGLGQQANSWVETGDNMPVSADQISEAFGRGDLGQMASQFGMTEQQASGGLAQLLPELVNQMTPSGQVPDDQNDMISEALAQLTPRTRA